MSDFVFPKDDHICLVCYRVSSQLELHSGDFDISNMFLDLGS